MDQSWISPTIIFVVPIIYFTWSFTAFIAFTLWLFFNMLSETAEPTAIDSDIVGTTAVLGLLSMALLLPKFLSLGHGTGHREMEAVPSAHT